MDTFVRERLTKANIFKEICGEISHISDDGNMQQ